MRSFLHALLLGVSFVLSFCFFSGEKTLTRFRFLEECTAILLPLFVSSLSEAHAGAGDHGGSGREPYNSGDPGAGEEIRILIETERVELNKLELMRCSHVLITVTSEKSHNRRC